MRYFNIEPEVAGGLGEKTDLDTSTHPPRVHKLHYEFAGWEGDALMESFPCFLAADQLAEAIEQTGLTGVRFAPVRISTTYEFKELYPGLKLPKFRWKQVHGRAADDDFGIGQSLILVVSQRGLELVRPFGLKHAEIAD